MNRYRKVLPSLLILAATLMIGGCSTTQQPSIGLPPSSLMQAPPQDLKTFSDGVHPLEVVSDNYSTYHIVKTGSKVCRSGLSSISLSLMG